MILNVYHWIQQRDLIEIQGNCIVCFERCSLTWLQFINNMPGEGLIRDLFQLSAHEVCKDTSQHG